MNASTSTGSDRCSIRSTSIGAFNSVGSLLDGSSLIFWFSVYTLVRYSVPDIAVWLGYC